jgi:hypothetical protein
MAVTVFWELRLTNLQNVNRPSGECSASVFRVKNMQRKDGNYAGKENVRIATLGGLTGNQGKVDQIGGSGKFLLPE